MHRMADTLVSRSQSRVRLDTKAGVTRSHLNPQQLQGNSISQASKHRPARPACDRETKAPNGQRMGTNIRGAGSKSEEKRGKKYNCDDALIEFMRTAALPVENPSMVGKNRASRDPSPRS